MAKNSLVVVIAIVVVVAAVFYLYQYWPSAEVQQPAKIKLGGLEIAEKTIKFVENMEKTDGTFSFSLECNLVSEVSCENLEQNASQLFVNLVLVRAYDALSEAAGKEVYSMKAQEETKKSVETCFKDPVKYNYCPEILPLTIREYQRTNDGSYIQVLDAFKSNLLNGGSNSSLVNIIAIDAIANLYAMSPDESLKAKAVDSLSKVDERQDSIFNGVVLNLDGRKLYTLSCPRQQAFLDVYSITKDQQHLQSAERFFDEVRLSSHVKEFNTSESILDCVTPLLKLHDFTSNSKYREEASVLLAELALNYFDSQDYPKLAGRDGILSTRDKIKNIERTDLTAIAAWAFAKVGEKEFVIAS